jgi:N6-adenosine-specific RNA methylase IME4
VPLSLHERQILAFCIFDNPLYYQDFDLIPRGVYGAVYADPAWTYQDKALAGNRGAGCKYDLMTDAELYAMPVSELCAKDCICFMWVTYPKLAEGLQLMSAWGFQYKTVAFTWVKRTTANNKLFWGMGRWTRANPEICILGTKGHPKRVNAGVHSVIESPIGPHSRKPQEARDRINTLIGCPISKIELFARGDSVGFDGWGNTPTFVP